MKKLSHLVAIAAMSCLMFSSAVFAVAGKFQFVNGTAQVTDSKGQQRTVAKGGEVNEGDTVATSANGFTQIKMEDGGFFAVRPNTTFKIDTFTFNGKEDGSEKGVFSLIKGSLRSVTGLIGKKHQDNYKIQTATSTIGIRGSGADVGYGEGVGTAVRTLFGGHTLTSHGQTIKTGPGQVALAPPGEGPKIVPYFPFNTDNSGDGQSGGRSANADQGGTESNKKSEESDGSVAENDDVIIPVITTDGTNFTENVTSTGAKIGTALTLPAGNYSHFISAIRGGFGGTPGFVVAEQSGNNSAYAASNYTFNSDGVLIGVADSHLDVFDWTFPALIVTDASSSLSATGGNVFDVYHTPDDSIFIGRVSNVSVTTTCAVCSGTDVFVSVHSLVGLLTAPSLVQTLTGTTNYTLAASTHPTDALGNVGVLNSASLSANFTNQTASYGVNLTINNNTLDAVASNIPIVTDGFSANTYNSTLTVACTVGCGGNTSLYGGDLGGAFFGNAAASAALAYDFFLTSQAAGNFTDYIHGLAVFTAGAPTATPSVAGLLGGGGAAVGSIGTMPGYFNDFNVVDNVNFSSRQDLSGNVIAWNKLNTAGGDTSFSAVGAAVQDGADATLGVVWGRWTAYNANNHNNGLNSSLAPIGGLSVISGTHITTLTEMGSYASFTGTGMVGAVGTYALAPGSFPSGVNGALSGVINAASATVNFSSLQITAFSVTGSGGSGGFGGWTVSGSGSIANFMSSTGINVTNGSTINGAAVGGFVGTQAQGLISTIGLTDGTDKLGAAVYMKR